MKVRPFRRMGILLVILGVSPLVYGQSVKDQVYEKLLPNGLQVLIKEDHRAPVAYVELRYKVGSLHEQVGKTGLAHMLEHMMFKSTKKLKVGEFGKIMNDLGASFNATTSTDRTNYYATVPINGLNRVLELEADRMANLRLLEEELTKERGVVLEERRMRMDDVPGALLYEQFFVAAHTGGPYRHMPIGWANDIKQYHPKDVYDFYKKYYSPSNAVLVIVGDVDAASTYQVVKRYFGRVKSHLVEPMKKFKLPPVSVTRHMQLSAPANQSSYLLGFSAPSMQEAPQSAIALLMVLDRLNGEDGLLNQRLVQEKKLVSSIAAYYNGPSLADSLVVISADPLPGVSYTVLHQAILAVLSEVASAPLDEAYLARAKAQYLASSIYQQDSIARQGGELARYHNQGLGYDFADQIEGLLNSLPPQLTQTVAKEVFVATKATSAWLQPSSSKTAQ